MGDTMIVVHALLLIVYLGAILVIAMALLRLGRQVPLGSLMTSGLITFLVAQGKLIRFMEADSTFDTPSARQRERGEEVKKRAGALRAVFAAMEHMPP
jgi:hypothetical protein